MLFHKQSTANFTRCCYCAWNRPRPAAPASTVLPVLARGFSSLPVLHFRIQAFGRYASRRAFLIKTLRLRLRYIGHHPLERNVHHRRHKGPQQLIHFRARRRIAVRKIRVRDLNAVHRNQMFVIVDVCRARHGRGANHLLAAVGSQLKRLAPDDCGEVLLVIHLRLLRDKSSACLHILARPPGILGDNVGTRKQTDHENSCKFYSVLQGGLLPASATLNRDRVGLPGDAAKSRASPDEKGLLDKL